MLDSANTFGKWLFFFYQMGKIYQKSSTELKNFNPLRNFLDLRVHCPHLVCHLQGLVKDDIILEFGPINSSNFKSLQDIASTVRAGVNTDIPITVLRNEGTRQRLVLRPQPFEGQGLVGCYFLNVENVER